jgi:hypothetical protein
VQRRERYPADTGVNNRVAAFVQVIKLAIRTRALLIR